MLFGEGMRKMARMATRGRGDGRSRKDVSRGRDPRKGNRRRDLPRGIEMSAMM